MTAMRMTVMIAIVMTIAARSMQLMSYLIFLTLLHITGNMGRLTTWQSRISRIFLVHVGFRLELNSKIVSEAVTAFRILSWYGW